MNLDRINKIKSLSKDIKTKVQAYREYLHANPELSYEEHETMHFVSEKLTDLGIKHSAKIGGTGVV